MLNIFSCAPLLCMSSSVKWLFIFFCPFCNFFGGGCFVVQFWKFFTYSRYKCFVRYVICNYILPICSLSFKLSWRAKVLILMKSNLLIFPSRLWFWSKIWELFTYFTLQRFSFMFYSKGFITLHFTFKLRIPF